MSLQKIEKAILTAQRIAHWEAYLIEYDHKKILMNTYATLSILNLKNYLIT